MTVTTPDRPSALNASGQTRPARGRAAAEPDPRGRHRAAAPQEISPEMSGAEHRDAPSVVPAGAGFQSYSMFSGGRPANAVPVYRSAAGHGSRTRSDAAGAGGSSASGGEAARVPGRSPSPGRAARSGSGRGPGAQRPSAPDRSAAMPRPRAAEPKAGDADSSAFPSRRRASASSSGTATTRASASPRTGARRARSDAVSGGSARSTTEAELSALLLGGAPTRPIGVTPSPSTRAGRRERSCSRPSCRR